MTSLSAENSKIASSQTEKTTSVPRKRGRKPNVITQEKEKTGTQLSSMKTPKTRGRKPKSFHAAIAAQKLEAQQLADQLNSNLFTANSQDKVADTNLTENMEEETYNQV